MEQVLWVEVEAAVWAGSLKEEWAEAKWEAPKVLARKIFVNA